MKIVTGFFRMLKAGDQRKPRIDVTAGLVFVLSQTQQGYVF